MRAVAALLVVCSCAAPRAAATGPRVATLRERIATVASAKGDIRDVYKKVAPGTVLVRSRHGFGTGVVIDARGFILTNHHVIADSETVDFKRRVKVELGALTPQGYMEKRPETYVAWVLKSDPLVDLAVLKLEAPPPGLTAVEVSTADPTPGEPVAAVGHGGIGLLWAIRDGEVSSIGKLATHMAQLAGAGPEADKQRAELQSQVPALVIQSSCQISPGDSGGPLVNRSGQLVGVNAFLQSDPTAPVAANFHVHVAEVRKFLEAVPSEPIARAPDPHELSKGGLVEKLDADGDGIDETTAYELHDATVVFADLGEGVSIAVASDDGRTMVWSGDRLVIEAKPGSGRGTAWKLEEGKPPSRVADGALLLDVKALPKKAAARFDALEKNVLAPYGLAINEPLDVVPDPYAVARWKLFDADGDRKFDSAYAGATVLIDPKEALAEPITQAPIAVVRRERRTWALIGTQTLASEDGDSGAVTFGDARGQLFAARLLDGLDEHEKKRTKLALRRLVPRLAAEGSPWPHPVADVGTDVLAEESGIKGLEHAVVSVVGLWGSSLIFELDRAQVASPGEMEKRARRGQGADMAWVRRSQTEWFLYDTDHDGAFDVMLFQPPTGAVEGFRLENGVVKRAPELDGEKTVRPGLLKDEQQRQALAALAKVFFNPEVVEP